MKFRKGTKNAYLRAPVVRRPRTCTPRCDASNMDTANGTCNGQTNPSAICTRNGTIEANPRAN
eukprot:40525-Amphidinium_carterae.1